MAFIFYDKEEKMKMSKMTDYALVLLADISDIETISARILSERTKVPLATTNKLLKALTKSNILRSKGGKTGGFSLTKTKREISIYDVLVSIDGTPPIFTHCASGIDCMIKSHCKIQKNSSIINQAIIDVLRNKTVQDLI